MDRETLDLQIRLRLIREDMERVRTALEQERLRYAMIDRMLERR